MEQLDFLRDAGETRRFHTWPVLRQQNVAEHSWHVAMLAHVLYGQEEPGITPAFLMACLTHDMAECKVGDIPSPAKRGMDAMFRVQDAKEPVPDETTTFREAWGIMEQGILANYSMDWEKFLTPEEQRRLKFVDVLDGMFYCIRERAMGNKLIESCYRNFASYAKELLPDAAVIPFDAAPHPSDPEWDAYLHAKDLWEQYND